MRQPARIALEDLAMIRWLLWLLAGALLGGIVHLVAVLILPRTATQDAYSRLTPIAPVNTVAAVPQPAPQSEVMPFMDPAFATAVCRYDLTEGPIKLSVPVSAAYTSVSFYTRRGVAYYAINDRSAGRRADRARADDDGSARQAARGGRRHRGRPADRGIADQHRADHAAGAGARARPDAGGARGAHHGDLPPAADAGGADSAGVVNTSS